MTHEFSKLNLPSEPYKNFYPDMRSFLDLIEQVKSGGPLPQLIMMTDVGNMYGMNGFNNVLAKLLLDVSDSCYEFYDNYQWKMESSEIYF